MIVFSFLLAHSPFSWYPASLFLLNCQSGYALSSLLSWGQGDSVSRGVTPGIHDSTPPTTGRKAILDSRLGKDTGMLLSSCPLGHTLCALAWHPVPSCEDNHCPFLTPCDQTMRRLLFLRLASQIRSPLMWTHTSLWSKGIIPLRLCNPNC